MTETRQFLNPLPSLALVAASTAVQAGRLNRYNAAAGALSPKLPELADLGFGTRLIVQKYDSSANYVTIGVAAGSGDLIGNQQTSLVLSRHLEAVELQSINDTWEVVGHYLPAPPGTLVSTEGVAVIKNKSISGADNTITNVPMSALGVGKVAGVNAAGAPASYSIAKLTASQYAGLPIKDPNTLYIVVP